MTAPSQNKPGRRPSIAAMVILVILGCAAATFAATPEQVDQAIKDGVKCIYNRQQPDGTWERPMDVADDQPGGLTAMQVYALLSAGENDKDPRLAKAIKYIQKTDFTGTYVLGFQALALSKLPQTPQIRAALKQCAQRLMAGAQKPAPHVGLYGYDCAGTPSDYYDHSCSQYGALGAWACADAGIDIPNLYWQTVDTAWRGTQNNDGGWGYTDPINEPDSSTISMTTAGIATLYICNDSMFWTHGSDCRGNVADKSIDKAIKWVLPYLNDERSFYTLYGVERMGIASGYKYFGKVDWFEQGADMLLRTQHSESGGWKDKAYGTDVATAYAVLFLSRGRAPMVMNKLQYNADSNIAKPIPGSWNERPRDAAGASKFVGDQLETLLNWQIVDLDQNPDEFHDAPILYLAGRDSLKFTPAQEARLRKFIEDGGLLLGNADCASQTFSTSFRALCEKLFDGRYKFRALPADHPIFTHQQFPAALWKSKMGIEGLSNGVRELALLIPQSDPSKFWQARQAKSSLEPCELIADIYLYSIDRQFMNHKDVTWIIHPDPGIAATSTIKLARIQYNGNWDPEPAGWRRLSAIVHNTSHINLEVTPVPLGNGELAKYTIAHLTGTDDFQLDDAARAELKTFVTNGGLLIIDAAGGSKPFADAAEKELAQIFGDSAAQQLEQPLPLDSPTLAGIPLDHIAYRSIVHATLPGQHGPLIRAIQFNDRPGVIFSREDLSAGLVGQNIDGIIGYTPDTATELMTKIIQSAIKPTKP